MPDNDNEMLDDIYTYSHEGINDVKQDATGENVRQDIGGITSGDIKQENDRQTNQDPLA